MSFRLWLRLLFAGAIFCSPLTQLAKAEVTGDLRLVNGDKEGRGRVEVFLNGFWSSICHYVWEDSDAKVVCTQLGYPASTKALSYRQAFYGQGSGPILVGGFQCLGTEQRLLDCPYQTMKELVAQGTSINSHIQDAGVSCTVPTVEEIRLAGGSGPHEGRVEVKVDGEWGTVCGNDFDDREAYVICRYLGYSTPYSGEALGTVAFGPGKGPVIFNLLSCNGQESDLLQCSSRYHIYFIYPPDSCPHTMDVGVRCQGTRISSSTKGSVNNQADRRSSPGLIGGLNTLNAGTSTSDPIKTIAKDSEDINSSLVIGVVIASAVLILLLVLLILFRNDISRCNCKKLKPEAAVSGVSIYDRPTYFGSHTYDDVTFS